MIGKKAAIIATAATLGAVAGPPLAVAIITGIGFGAGGIASGTLAAEIMASYGGFVTAGSTCAILQSIGAAGLGAAQAIASALAIGSVAAGVAAVGATGGADEDGQEPGEEETKDE
ncbi:hypothetical protein BX616_008658 [Lobosporangium transversale]|uniref:Uncharacterized protein n=1 Tax=Lobosporangium transversale TaxID=64571 RepID=A0A1Y2GDG9_9FUNG|nr:hypothetical protein BCR41DRAFT_400830 [Lobosporangium transversale]KAF9914249.1 hypothetical protein BX616_008658 [Lobosporangium transversale]ORZ04806.1 hypothetical protein BCR41DRAFT_400830 [Lobosporangium transversale]|eukprot:XP_021876743.1 hypothetical protein BCR41DRAFT_400830 [Lobosporangium transversale]